MQRRRTHPRPSSVGESYRSPAKAFVRRHLVPFFSASGSNGVPPAVWFFPGPEEAETEAYLAHGIPIHALLGFEWDPQIAQRIREQSPDLPLRAQALGECLVPPYRGPVCDWANLDFDGAAVTFREEINALVAHALRVDRAPRLALTSFASRDHTVLAESIVAMSAMRAIAPSSFTLGVDLLTAGNERLGLAVEDAVMPTVIAREFAVALLLIRAFGGRAYGAGDRRAAGAFRRAFDRAYEALRHILRDPIARYLDHRGAMPFAPAPELAAIVAARTIPLWIPEWLRFAYRTTNDHWMWSWYFRFDALHGRSVSLRAWTEKLLVMAPPLHLVDHVGRLLRAETVCPWCPRADTPVRAPERAPAHARTATWTYEFRGDARLIPAIGDQIRADGRRMAHADVVACWQRRGYTATQVRAALAWDSELLRARRRDAP